MLAKRSFKTTLYIVRFLVVVFGLSIFLDVLDAYADGDAPIQRTITDVTTQTEKKKSDNQIKCPVCKTAWRTKTTITTTTKVETAVMHMHLINGQWSVQNKKLTRSSTTSTQNSWSACSHIYRNGSKCAG